MKKIALLAMAAAGLVMASSAQAGTANMQVTADVAATCSVDAATMAFGTYDTLTGAELGSPATSIGFTCSNGTTYTVTLDNGQNYDGTGTTRRLNHSGNGTTADDYLTYGIFEDASFQVPFAEMSAAATGAPQSVTVYGRIDGNQTTAKAGAYDDTVLITITAN